jgi:hypothetical protein
VAKGIAMTDPRSAEAKPALGRNDRFILGAVVFAAMLVGLVLYNTRSGDEPTNQRGLSLRRKPRPERLGRNEGRRRDCDGRSTRREVSRPSLTPKPRIGDPGLFLLAAPTGGVSVARQGRRTGRRQSHNT